MYRGRHGWKQQARWREAHTAAREAVAAGGKALHSLREICFFKHSGKWEQ